MLKTSKNYLPGLLAALTVSGATMAQEGAVERLEVTGTRLKRANMETSSPIKVIDSEKIERSGVTSVGDLIRKSASSSPTGNFSGSSGYVASGASTIDLLGLGADRTLVLLDGKRLPVDQGLGAVNTDNIPISMIERIEILSGGASAVYGSDAVGGVVNIITKKNLDGASISMSGSTTENGGGEETDIQASFGGSVGQSFNYIVSAGYKGRTPIYKENRDLAYVKDPERLYTVSAAPAGTFTYRPIINDGSSLSVGNWTPSSNCPEANIQATVPSSPNDEYCAGLRDGRPVELVPRKEESYASAFFNADLNTFNLSGMFNYSKSVNTVDDGIFYPYGYDPYSGAQPTISLNAAQAAGLNLEGLGNVEAVQVIAQLPGQPRRSYVNTNETYGSNFKLDGDLDENWTMSTGVSYYISTSSRLGKNITNKNRLQSLLLSNDLSLDPTINLLGATTNDSSLIASAFDDLNSSEESRQGMADIFLSGELGQLPGGPLAIGFGSSVSIEEFQQNPDARDVIDEVQKAPVYTGTFADKGEGDRNVASVYAEFNAPLSQTVELDGAVRYDNYSDFGDTTNFGLGTKVALLDSVTFRAKGSTSYKAPLLSYISQEGGGGYYSVIDDLYCQRELEKNRVCDPANPVRQVYVDSKGSDELKPETGVSYTGGFVFDPMPGLSLVADYYHVDLKNTFRQDSIQEVVDDWYDANGATATSAGEINSNVINVDEDGIISTVSRPYRNLGKLQIRALNLSTNYSKTFGDIRFAYGNEAFRMISYKLQEAEGKEIRQQLGYFGIPKYRFNNSFTFGYDVHSMTMRAQTVAGTEIDPENADEDSAGSKVGEYTEYDLAYSFNSASYGSLQLGVNNVFDTIGGVEDGNFLGSESVVTSSLYSVTGRSYFMKLTKTF